MHDILTIAIISDPKERSSAMATRSMALRQFFRPCVLAFLALALAVGGWGYGYKLSQYLHHSDVSKASATRMWVEHRDDSLELPDHHRQQHEILSPQFFCVTVPTLAPRSRSLVFALPVQSHTLTFVSPLHPLRAPPISS